MYYRNRNQLTSYEGAEVDADSLWIRKGELMVLVDDDAYITAPYAEGLFYSTKID